MPVVLGVLPRQAPNAVIQLLEGRVSGYPNNEVSIVSEGRDVSAQLREVVRDALHRPIEDSEPH